METWLNDEDFKTAEERGDVFSTKKPDEDAEAVEVSELNERFNVICSSAVRHP